MAEPTDDPELLTWSRPGPTAGEQRADLGIAVALLLTAVGSLTLFRAAGVLPEAAPLPISVLVLACICLPLAWRRRYPSLVAAVVAVAFVALGELAVAELTFSNIALFMAIYTVGAWERSRHRATVARAVIIGGMFLWLLVSFFRTSTADLDLQGEGVGAMTPIAALMLQQFMINVLYFAGAHWFGNHAWNAARQRAISEARTRELQAERARLARQALTIERLRIARELHDAVAHHVSLMGVQAAAARALLNHDPDAARRQIQALEDSSRAAVGELYELLGTLRDDEAVDPDSAPGIDLLPALVAESRTAGLGLDLQTVGVPRALPPLVSLNLYRIAQESLTNVLKHAGAGATATVRLRYFPDGVELEIADDGAGRAPRDGTGRRAPSPGAGLGLRGMQERAGVMAGSVTAQPRLTGGFVVRVEVPLPALPPPDPQHEPEPEPEPAHSPLETTR